jgi:hypothetical protein
MAEEKKVEALEDDLDGPKLSPSVPEKVLKMWYVEDKKNNFEVKKVCENKSAKAIIEWDGKTGIIKNSVGVSLQIYKTFGEAAEISTYKKIEDKKKKWEAYVKASMIINNQISELYDQLDKIQGRSEDEEK